MIDGQIEYNVNAPLVADGNELLQILLRTERGIDLIIIGHVVFMIGRGFEYGREPQSLHAERSAGGGVAVVEIVHAVDYSADIARAVSVGIGEGTDEYLIEYPVMPLGGLSLEELFVLYHVFAVSIGSGLPASGKAQNHRRSQQYGKQRFYRSHFHTPITGSILIYNNQIRFLCQGVAANCVLRNEVKMNIINA